MDAICYSKAYPAYDGLYSHIASDDVARLIRLLIIKMGCFASTAGFDFHHYPFAHHVLHNLSDRK